MYLCLTAIGSTEETALAYKNIWWHGDTCWAIPHHMTSHHSDSFSSSGVVWWMVTTTTTDARRVSGIQDGLMGDGSGGNISRHLSQTCILSWDEIDGGAK